MTVESVTSNNVASRTFTIKGLGNERYWLKTDEDTGNIQIWNEQVQLDRDVGTVDPHSGAITFNESFIRGASAKEKEVLGTAFTDHNSPNSLVVRQSIYNASKKSLVRSKNPTTVAEVNAANIAANKLIGGNNMALGGNDSTPTKTLEEQVQAARAVPGTRKRWSNNIRFPESVTTTGQDVIKFQMLEYKPRKFKSGGEGGLGAFEASSRAGKLYKNRKTIGAVTLPIPGGISDTTRVEWGQSEMNPFRAQLASLAMTTLGEGFAAGANQFSGIIDTFNRGENKGMRDALSAFIAAQATGVQDLLTRTTGAIVNPNMELLFKAPSLRPFAFSFRLSPRNDTESRQIRSILRFFKQGMAPIRTTSQLFLKSPHTFRIQYLHRNQRDHEYLNFFKECALISCGVEYTPEGNYSTYQDGAMTSYQLNLAFEELEPIYNDDYGNIDGNSDQVIGF